MAKSGGQAGKANGAGPSKAASAPKPPQTNKIVNSSCSKTIVKQAAPQHVKVAVAGKPNPAGAPKPQQAAGVSVNVVKAVSKTVAVPAKSTSITQTVQSSKTSSVNQRDSTTATKPRQITVTTVTLTKGVSTTTIDPGKSPKQTTERIKISDTKTITCHSKK